MNNPIQPTNISKTNNIFHCQSNNQNIQNENKTVVDSIPVKASSLDALDASGRYLVRMKIAKEENPESIKECTLPEAKGEVYKLFATRFPNWKLQNCDDNQFTGTFSNLTKGYHLTVKDLDDFTVRTVLFGPKTISDILYTALSSRSSHIEISKDTVCFDNGYYKFYYGINKNGLCKHPEKLYYEVIDEDSMDDTSVKWKKLSNDAYESEYKKRSDAAYGELLDDVSRGGYMAILRQKKMQAEANNQPMLRPMVRVDGGIDYRVVYPNGSTSSLADFEFPHWPPIQIYR